ncbi:MAG: hypothetical protein ACPL7O_00335 [Armatimonadota bacterium]
MIELLPGGHLVDPTREACVCVCYSPGCQTNESYTNGYSDGLAAVVLN